ncbi:MAG TPA: pyrroloquinoline quinone-dependent dehydrogenase [Caulobacteraceae bacterium]|jgi:quinoprotein glucose dehydrogenase
MHGPALAAIVIGAMAVTLVGAPASAADPKAAAKPAPKPATGKSFDFQGWSTYLGSGSSSQFSSLTQIDKANVGKLQVAWTYMAGDGPAPRLGPLVVNGKMYVLASDIPEANAPATVGANGEARRPAGAQRNTIVCLDPATGKELWRHRNVGAVGDRGFNYWQSADGKDRRLFYVVGGDLTAINADTGEAIPSFGKDGKVDMREGLKVPDIAKVRPLHTDNPGRVYKNLIIMSLPAGNYDYESAPADIHAYDTRTGKLAWVFHVVPEKGEYGYDTWPEKDHEKEGGVHNWSESTIDDQLGIMFVPTGTARYDFYGGNRPGNNLFGNSLLALDANTGKRLWHFQAVHHDLWDYDFPQAPKLLTIHKDGKDVRIVAQASKQGFLYVFDERTGKPIWPIEERPVPQSDVPGEKTSPTQPFPTWPKPFARQVFTEDMINPYIPEADQQKLHDLFKKTRHEGIFTPPSIQGTIQMPGHNGGANWGTTAVDPTRQRLFVMSKQLPVLNILSLSKNPEIEAKAEAAMPNGGGDVKPYKGPADFMLQSNSLSAINPPWSTITAYDMNTGDIMWQVPDGEVGPLAAQGIKDTGSHAPRGSPVATASDLLFMATSSDRKFRARDADTGKVIWEYDLPAASEGVPAVYQSGGREFIVIPVGGNGLFTNGFGLPKPGPNQYIAFALPAGAKVESSK